jgi:hypothetical protein
MLDIIAKTIPESIRQHLRSPYQKWKRFTKQSRIAAQVRHLAQQCRTSDMGREAISAYNHARRIFYTNYYESQLDDLVKHPEGPVIVVHTAGKDGSRGVRIRLLNHISEKRLFKTHLLEHRKPVRPVKAVASKPHEIPPHIFIGEVLANYLTQTGSNPLDWIFLTTIRDPIARNVSSFFHSIQCYYPHIYRDLLTDDVVVSELIERFLKKYPHEHVIKWPGNQISDNPINIDIYEKGFDPEVGYQIIRRKNKTLVLMRLTDIDSIFQEVMGSLLGESIEPPEPKNVTSETPLASLYDHFKSELTVPPSLRDRLYSSKFAQAFFTDEEICQFHETWG